MFTTYKNIFCSMLSFIKNDFNQNLESSNNNEDYSDKNKNGTNLDELSMMIIDGKLDGEDLKEAEELIKSYEIEKDGVYKETAKEVANLMYDVIEAAFDDGYMVNNSDDYNVLKNLVSKFNSEIILPDFSIFSKYKSISIYKDSEKGLKVYADKGNDSFEMDRIGYIGNDGKFTNNESTFDADYLGTDNEYNSGQFIDNLTKINKSIDSTNNPKNSESINNSYIEEYENNIGTIESKIKLYQNNTDILNNLIKSKNIVKEIINELKNNYTLNEIKAEDFNKLKSLINKEISNSKNKDKQKTKTENKTETEVKKELKTEKTTNSNIEGSKVDNENIAWNSSEFSKEGIALINKSLGISGDKFTKETLAKIYEISTDGKIGLGVLKKIALVDANNNAINGLNKDMFNSGALEKGNSSKIIFNEKVEVKKSPEKTTIEVNKTDEKETEKQEIKEESNKVEQKEDSILNDVKEGFTESGDYISEKFNSLKEWIKELFETDEQLAKFVGKNGLEVGIDYDKDTNEISLDTSYFDSVLDYKVEGIPKDVDTKEEALAYVKSQISKIKEVYDNKTAETDLRNSIAHKQRMKEDFGHELPFTKEEIEFMNKETKKEETKEKIEEVKKEQKVEVKETEVKVSDNISLKYDSENIKNVISSLEEGSSSYKAEIGSFGEGKDITKYEQKINVYKMAGKTYLEVESGSLWKANPDMRIKSEKDINEKNINKLISQLEK